MNNNTITIFILYTCPVYIASNHIYTLSCIDNVKYCFISPIHSTTVLLMLAVVELIDNWEVMEAVVGIAKVILTEGTLSGVTYPWMLKSPVY